eukprot:PhF_6_TR27914/c0_g1_i3/m.41002
MLDDPSLPRRRTSSLGNNPGSMPGGGGVANLQAVPSLSIDPSGGVVDEEVDLAEEFTNQNAAQEMEDLRYNDRVAKLSKNIKKQQHFLHRAGGKAASVEDAVKSLLPEDWCGTTPCKEVIDFRSTMAQVSELEWKQFEMQNPGISVEKAFAKMPPRYFTGDMSKGPGASNTLKSLNAEIVHGSGPTSVTSTYVLDVERTANEFIDYVIMKRNEDAKSQDDPRDYMLKVVGRYDFLYGDDHKLINYHYIRSCMMKGLKIHLTLMKSDARADLGRKRFEPRYDRIPLNLDHKQINIHQVTTLEKDRKTGFKHMYVPTHLSSWDMNIP